MKLGNYLLENDFFNKDGVRNILLVIIPIILSLIFMVVVPRQPYESDGKEYDILARNLLSGKGYSLDGKNPYLTNGRAPLYPLLLAFFYLVFGYTPTFVILFQLILIAIVPLLIKKIIILGGFNKEEAFWGALFCSLYPFGYIYVQQIITETLTTFLFVLGVLCCQLVWLNKEQSFLKNIIFGVLITLPALSKVQHVVLIYGLLLFLFFRSIYEKSFIKTIKSQMIPLFLGFLLTISPWALRNFYHTGRFSIFGEGEFGERILMGFYESQGKWFLLKFWNEKESGDSNSFKEWKLKLKEAEEISKTQNIPLGKVKLNLVLEEMKKKPFETIRGYIVRFYSFWLMIPTEKSLPIKIVTIFFDFSVMFLFVIGFLYFRKKLLKNFLVVYFTIIVENVVLAACHTEARYSISLKPFVVMIIGILFWNLVLKSGYERWKKEEVQMKN